MQLVSKVDIDRIASRMLVHLFRLDPSAMKQFSASSEDDLIANHEAMRLAIDFVKAIQETILSPGCSALSEFA